MRRAKRVVSSRYVQNSAKCSTVEVLSRAFRMAIRDCLTCLPGEVTGVLIQVISEPHVSPDLFVLCAQRRRPIVLNFR